MFLLCCSCLNVHVHSKGNPLTIKDYSELCLPENVCSDSFFSSEIYRCTLDLAGITMSQKQLCNERILENWSITRCLCCMMDIYAKCIDDNDTVFVSTKAQIDSDKIRSMMESAKYSSVFKLILPDVNDNFFQNMGVEFQNGNIDHSIEVVQSQVSNYLKEEQRAMELRIKQFTEQQQQNYTNLLQKVRKHKQAMIYLLVKMKETEVQTKGLPGGASVESSSSTSNKDTADVSLASMDSAFDRNEIIELPENEPKQEIRRPLRRTISNPSKSNARNKYELKRAPASIDVGGVFDMEEFEMQGQPLSGFSDDESGDSSSDVSTDVIHKKPDLSLYGNSLPVTIPAFSNVSRCHTFEDEEKDSPVEAPVDIAASIRALACSVRDGTEMFGELPRRRLNTGELLSSRPI